MIYVKIHRANGETILAACDEEILGQTFTGGCAKLRVSEGFYGGELVSEDTFIERMRSFTIMNLVGERTVSIAMNEGYVDAGCVMDIGGTRHAQVVKG